MIINQIALKIVEKRSLRGQHCSVLPEKTGLPRLPPATSCLYLGGHLNHTFHMWLLTVFSFSSCFYLSYDSQNYWAESRWSTVSKFSIINSSPNRILVTSQATHSEITGSPSALHPLCRRRLYLVLHTGKITIRICEALEILQWQEIQGGKKMKTEISMVLCIESE